MKRIPIPEQRWLHEPDAAELKRLIRRANALAWYGWAAALGFAIAFCAAVAR